MIVVDSINPRVKDTTKYDAAIAVIGSGRGTSALNAMAKPGIKTRRPSFVVVGQEFGFGISYT